MAKILINKKNAIKLTKAIYQVSPANAVQAITLSLKHAELTGNFSLDALIERLDELPHNE